MTDLSSLIELAEKATGPDRTVLSRLDKSGDCWLWTGATDHKGRGRVWYRGKIMLHHRAVWTILIGVIPDGSMLCHHCDNPRCANPMHMYVGDAKSNVRDMISRGRHWLQANVERAKIVGRSLGKSNDWSTGESNPKAKLSKDQAAHIRASGLSTKQLSEKFGVDRTTVQRIRRGASWPDVRALQSKGPEA